MVSIKDQGVQMSHHFQYLKESVNNLAEQVDRGHYWNDYHKVLNEDPQSSIQNWTQFNFHLARLNAYMTLQTIRSSDRKKYNSLKSRVRDLTHQMGRYEKRFSSDRKFSTIVTHCLSLASEECIVITASDDITCKLIQRQTSSHVKYYVYSLHEGKSLEEQDSEFVSFTRGKYSRRYKKTSGPAVMITTDHFADAVFQELAGLDVAVINYDAKTRSPYKLHHPTSDCTERQLLKHFSTEYEDLRTSLDEIRHQQWKPVTSVTTIARWWRRSHLALKQRSAIIIQRNLRSVLCRIRLQKDQIAAAEKSHAAKSIQIWRRYIVLQRKKRRQETAARSNPLRDRGLPLPPRSRSTLRRDKRNAKGRYKKLSKHEEGLLATIRDLQQSVQSLQEANKSMEKNVEYLLQQLRDKDGKLSCSKSSASSNNGIIKKSVHHNTSELSCRGNVIGTTLHEPSVSGLSSRVSVLDNSHRHGGDNLHHHDATITQQQVIGAVLPSESSGRENVLDKSVQQSSGVVRRKEAPISSSRGKSSRRRRKRRRRRSKRWKRIDHTLKKCAALAISHIPTPNHPVSQPDLLPMSTFCDKMKQQHQLASVEDRNVLLRSMCHLVIKSIDAQAIHPSAIDCLAPFNPTAVNSIPSEISRSTSADEAHSTSSFTSKSTSNPSISSKMTSPPVVASKRTKSDLVTPKPIIQNELQPSSSTYKVDNPPSSTSTTVGLPSPASIITEEETSICHEKPMSYLSALLGNATNIG